MSDVLLVLIVSIIFLVFLFSGMYIHSVLLGVGIIGLLLVDGTRSVFTLLLTEPFTQAATYTLTTIPLFVLMAQFVLRADVVKDVFAIVFRVSRGRRGVLGVLTILVGGLLGAVSGSGTASAAALGQVAVPELTRSGFRKDVAGAIAASGGSLSGIIPPSIILILYGVITETPIGKLFIGEVIPGILTMLVFIACMFYLLYKDRRETAETAVQTMAYDDVSLSRALIVIAISLFLAFMIFGGIYLGFVTPTEAGAVGAFAAFLAALLLGKVNMSFIKTSVLETLKITGMVMLILIRAKIFSRFMTLSLLPRKLIEVMEPLMTYPALVLAILSIVFFFLFMIMEGAAVIVMTVPVLLPVIKSMSVDVLWFGVFVSVICTLGLLSPPVGLSVYAVAGVSKIAIGHIFKQAMFFAVVAAIVVCGLMILFPSLATWLPSTM